MLRLVLSSALMLGGLLTALAASSEASPTSAPEPAAGAVPAGLLSIGIDESDWRTLLRGDVVVRDGSRRDSGEEELRASALVLVDAPAARAYAVIADHARQPEFSRCTKEVQVLTNEPLEGSRRIIRTRETHKSLWITARYSLEYVHDPAEGLIRWRLDPTARNDVKDNRGSWRVVGVDGGRCVLVYECAGLPGRLPRFLVDYFVRKDLPRFLRTLRSLIEERAL